MNDIWKGIEPQVLNIVLILIGILATAIVGMLALLQTKVKIYLATKTTLSQREALQRIAAEAYAWAEKEYKDQNSVSSLKLNAALSYASQVLDKAGLTITPDEIKGAIEKAVQDYKRPS